MKINVKIEVGNKKFSLTPEEMIELRDKLIQLTDYDASQPITIPFPVIEPQPRIYPTNPYIGDPLPTVSPFYEYTITCNMN